MRITRVKTYIVDGGFRPWTFVKVETSDPGLVGWGDCTDWGSPGPVAATVERYAERIIGKDPMASEAIWWELSAFSVRHTGGIAYKAMSGIDSALWDIRGKVLNAPVWQLLGGRMRDRLRLYWSHCGSTRAGPWAQKLELRPVRTIADLEDLAREVLERGFTAIKTNLMRLEDDPEGTGVPSGVGDAPSSVLRHAERIIGTFRETLGPDVGIALDVGFHFKLGGAARLARALEPYDLMWLETETLDAAALRTIRESTTTTICTGESLFGTADFRPFLELHAQDIVMPDLAWNGVAMGRRLADLAHAYDVLFAPHNCHSPLTTLVSANVCATVPNFYILEFDVDDAPWRDDLMSHPFEVQDGHLILPDRPGLGSDLIESELEKHPPTTTPTRADAMTTQGQPDLPAGGGRVFTVRAFLLGCLLTAFLGTGPLYVQFVHHTAPLNADSITAGAVFLFFLLTFVVNTALRKIHPPWVFTTGELVVIYTMMIVASTIPTKTLMANMIPVLPGASYYATPENEWAELILPLIPDWIGPHDPLAIKYFYEGAPSHVSVPWGAWLVPFAAWGIFIASFFAVMISSMVIVRRQWVEHERLVFPLTQVPLEMLQPPQTGHILGSLFRKPLLWIGIALPWIVLSTHGLHAYFNYIPRIETNTYFELFRDTTPFRVLLSFSVIGFTYLVNLEIGFSLWFFHVLMKLQSGLLNIIGYDIPGREEVFVGGGGTVAVGHEAMGATIALVLFVLWTSRRHLTSVFGKAFGTAPHVDDRDEIMSYRAAVITLLVGLIGMGLWLNASGMPLWLTPFFVGTAFAAFFALTRIIAEGGVGFSRTQLVPAVFTVYTFGTGLVGPTGLTSLGFTYTWSSEIRSPLMASVMHALKMMDSIGVRRPRPLLGAIVLAALIGTICSGLMTVWLAYTYGGINLQRWAFLGLPQTIFGFVGDKLQNPLGSDITLPRIAFAGLGGIVMAGLMYARHRFINWPLHYLGLPIATSLPISVGWFSIMIGWLLKLFIVRYGGVRLYRTIRPFFIGLIAGQISCGASWMVLDYLTGMVGNWVSVGVP